MGTLSNEVVLTHPVRKPCNTRVLVRVERRLRLHSRHRACRPIRTRAARTRVHLNAAVSIEVHKTVVPKISETSGVYFRESALKVLRN